MKRRLIFTIIFTLMANAKIMAQDQHLYRIAKIEVDPAQMKPYRAALKEQMNAAIRLEAGVLSYYAVADKNNPNRITIFETYADSAAYQAHIQTAHFKKYKEKVKDMVKSLVLEDVDLLVAAKKKEY